MGAAPHVDRRVLRQRISCLLLLLLALTLSSRAVLAHDSLSSYIQHRIHLEVGAQYIDVTVVLTFFEEWSFKERQRMDADNNRSLTRVERETYLAGLKSEFTKQLKLQFRERSVPLTALHEPRLDLLRNDQVAPAHHELRLFFFAPCPPGIRAGDSLVVEDGLWPHASALLSIQVRSSDGSVWESQETGGTSVAHASPGIPHSMRVKCIKPPAPLPRS